MDTKRKLSGVYKNIVLILLVGLSVFQLYTAGMGVFTPAKQRAIHLTFILASIFLLYAPSKKMAAFNPKLTDMLLFLLSIFCCLYAVVGIDAVAIRGGEYIFFDYIIGGIIILLVLEATRRAVGTSLTILGIISILYALLGPYMPGPFVHTAFSLKRLCGELGLSFFGIFGRILGLSATYIFLFILFGAVLSATGISKFFNDFAMAVAGNRVGGPAKVSIFFSGLMGMVSGSAVGNVATTGVFTIPLMKKLGYKPEFAGGVEAAASTGGQLVPPIMGAAAFIMSEFLGIPYIRVAVAAIIPALLYYFALWIMIDLEARKNNLVGTKNNLPDLKKVLYTRGHLVIPIGVIIYFLVEGKTPLFSAFWGIVIAFAVSFIRKETRTKPRDLLFALARGAENALPIGISCAAVGIITGVIGLTSLGMVISNAVIVFSNGQLITALVFTTIAVIILGMGLPTTAAYVVTASILAPALINMGLLPLVAHFFIFYFGVVAAVTPPVALASFAGAAIAGADFNKTGWVGFKLSLAGFIVPYIFAYRPVILLQEFTWKYFLFTSCFTILALLALAASMEGFFFNRELKILERIAFFVYGLILVLPLEMKFQLFITVISIFVAFIFYIKSKKSTELLE